METEIKKNNWKETGYIFTGCMFLGMGAGMFFGETATGLFLGMGAGFIISAIVKFVLAKTN